MLSAIFFSAVIFARSSPTTDVITQQGALHISDTGSVDVFYPREFRSPPNLTLETTQSYLDYTIVEQRANGFKLEVTAVVPPTTVEWQAKGVVRALGD